MAAVKQVELDLSAIQRPPSGKLIGYGTSKHRGNGAFKYRGTLFNSGSCKPPNSVCSAQNEQCNQQEQSINIFSNNLHNSSECTPLQSNVKEADVNKVKPRRIQSAKGRLERSINYISSSSSSMDESGECIHKRKPSVVDLNCVTDVPDKEEELMNAAIQKMNMKVTSEFHAKSAMRPSSAKDTFGHPSSKAEDLSQIKQNNIKPSVFGLRLGRQVCGGDSEIFEAWNNVDKEYPYKLCEEDVGKTCTELALKVSRQIPRTLKPLHEWMRRKTSEKVIGISHDKCLVFLSRDYGDDELPEVPPPQKADATLPFKSVVVTPRKEVPKKYTHPFFENHTFDTDWECSHTGVLNINNNNDISYLHNPPLRRGSSAIRTEITELENLLQGIGSLNSNCSFVQFQEEILKAKLLSHQLMGLRSSVTEEDPVDTFGLLKFYKEHDEMMKLIRERRDQCLQELQLLEQG